MQNKALKKKSQHKPKTESQKYIKRMGLSWLNHITSNFPSDRTNVDGCQSAYRQLSLQGPAPGRHRVQLVPQVLRLLRHVLKQQVLLLNLLPPLLQLGLQ